MVKTHFLLENLWISGTFLSKLGKSKRSSALIIINVVLFLVKYIGWLGILPNIFFMAVHCKTSIRNLWNPCKCQIRLPDMTCRNVKYYNNNNVSLSPQYKIYLCSIIIDTHFLFSYKHLKIFFRKCLIDYHYKTEIRNVWYCHTCQNPSMFVTSHLDLLQSY